MQKRVFLRNVDSGEPAVYCGPLVDKAGVLRAIDDLLDGEFDELVASGDGSLTMRIEIRIMTDEEVENLPEM